jgi:citrate synthase
MMAKEPATGDMDIRVGLEGVVAGETAISHVDGERCQLIYRGYLIDELVGKATHEEVSYLLLHGELPTRAQLADWTRHLVSARALTPSLLELLTRLPAQADPMALLRTAVSAMGLADSEAEPDAGEALRRQAIRAIAQVPTVVAAIGRLRGGQTVLTPDPRLGHAANFLFMLSGRVPSDQQTLALDTYFVLLADHGFNASTFTARTVAATQSDYYSAITAAIGALKGPLHGAANRRAMEMLMEIGHLEQIEAYVQRTLADHKRFMGFGHRVYKGEDPRARYLKAAARQLGAAANEPHWVSISERLQEAVWRAKQLYINVDFYSAPLLHHLGIPTPLFTTLFACARVAGWSAHVIEQAAGNRLIRPLSHYIGPLDRRFVPLDQR